MKTKIYYILIPIFFLAVMSCEADIPVALIVRNDSAFIYKTKGDSDQINQADTIKINSQKWNKINRFLTTNRNNWESTPASFAPDFSISQETFKLLGWENGKSIVISYTDNDGQAKQLQKEIKPGELDFLNEE